MLRLRQKQMDYTHIAGRAGRVCGLAVITARRINEQIDWAEVGQVVWHGLIALVVATYVAGELSGRWLHRLNDRLAQVLASTAKRPIPAKPVPTVVPTPVAHPLAGLAAELEAMTCRQLRVLTGARRKLPKRELIALALAC